jgi:hypothetical protein
MFGPGCHAHLSLSARLGRDREIITRRSRAKTTQPEKSTKKVKEKKCDIPAWKKKKSSPGEKV